VPQGVGFKSLRPHQADVMNQVDTVRVHALRDSLTMEQQQAEWVSAQAEELRVERERWSAALEASHRQIMHLTHKEAELEKCAVAASRRAQLALLPGEPQP
jgi:ABC-type phosphate transport system auxiliary subunit